MCACPTHMKTIQLIFFSLTALIILSCREHDIKEQPLVPLQESTKEIPGEAVIKVLQTPTGWVALKETLQPQWYITEPKRAIAWMNSDFQETSRYEPEKISEDVEEGQFRKKYGRSLTDVVVHPSGEVTAVSTSIDLTPGGIDYVWDIRVHRFKTDGSIVETLLTQLPVTIPQIPAFPLSLDRAKLVAYGEDVYVVARWKHNIIEAHRLSFIDNEFRVVWQKLVEPGHYVAMIGIIGGGFDNFHQGDRYCYVYAGVDGSGNLYVGAPSSEDLLLNHDPWFNDNLGLQTNPGDYDFGAAVLTKFSSAGDRIYSKLEGMSRQKRLLNMRVDDNGVYFIGRVKTGMDPNSWDAWLLKTDLATGGTIFESTIDVRDGDMFWDVDAVEGGNSIAVGTTDYVQNPGGLSVSDARKAAAIVLDAQGRKVREIGLPQGPSERGSEAMFVTVLRNGSIVFAGAHNAPGTHAPVYSDGFIAVRDLVEN
jgi:hypothetical protein